MVTVKGGNYRTGVFSLIKEIGVAALLHRMVGAWRRAIDAEKPIHECHCREQ